MRNLLDLIRGEQRRRRVGDSGGEFMVIHLNKFCGDIVPHTLVGGALIEMAPDEPLGGRSR